jgi:biopolymer transport protein ExbB
MKQATINRLFILGAILTTGPIWGLVGTIIGMISAFIGITTFGQSDPLLISGGINFALYITVAGTLALPLGVVIIIVTSIAVVIKKYRKHEE